MKKYQSVAICFVLTFLVCAIAFGKGATDDDFLPGYVVTSRMDTIKGLIQINDHYSNSLTCIFKESSNAPIRQFTPVDLISYAVDGLKYFLSEKITTESTTAPVFMECVLKGEVSLYHFQGRYFIKTLANFKELVIEHKEINRQGNIYSVKIELFKVVLEEELKNCVTISTLIKTTTLTVKSLHTLFTRYYNCIQEAYTDFETNKNSIKINLGLSMGVALSYLKFSNDGSGAVINRYLGSNGTMNSISLIPSVVVEFLNVNGKNKFRFATGLNFSNNEYQSEEKNTSTGLPRVSIKNTRIELPLLIKYNLSKRNHGPYLSGGFGLNSFLKWEDKINNTSNTLDYVTLFPSIIAGAGYRFHFYKKSCYIDGLFNRSQGLKGQTNSPTAHANNFMLSLGILF